LAVRPFRCQSPTEENHEDPFRRLVGGLAVTAVTGALTFAAPNAEAATATSCSVGITTGTYTPVVREPSFSASLSACPGFADAGVPYTFDLATLTVFGAFPLPGQPSVYQYRNVVATCGAIKINTSTGQLTATGCTYTP
jgi:hypothetical protein